MFKTDRAEALYYKGFSEILLFFFFLSSIIKDGDWVDWTFFILTCTALVDWGFEVYRYNRNSKAKPQEKTTDYSESTVTVNGREITGEEKEKALKYAKKLTEEVDTKVGEISSKTKKFMDEIGKILDK